MARGTQHTKHPRQRRHRLLRVARQVERVSRVVLVWIVLFGAVYGGGYLLLNGALFEVEQVVIRGDLQHMTESEIHELAAVPVGDTLFSVSMHEVQERLLKHPWIRSVAVRRKLPHSVWIFVEERRPVALLNLQGLYLVDEHAEIYKARDNADPADLPIFSGVTDVVVDQFGVGHSVQIEDLLVVHQSYMQHAVAEQLGCSEVHRDQYGRISVVTELPAMRVRLGTLQREEQWDRLLAVVQSFAAEEQLPQSIDLYIDRKAVVRYGAEMHANAG